MSRFRSLRRSQTGAAADLLAAAFHEDPFFEWLFPDPATRPVLGRAWMRVSAEASLDLGHAYGLLDGESLVATMRSPHLLDRHARRHEAEDLVDQAGEMPGVGRTRDQSGDDDDVGPHFEDRILRERERVARRRRGLGGLAPERALDLDLGIVDHTLEMREDAFGRVAGQDPHVDRGAAAHVTLLRKLPARPPARR